jgi:two-component system, sensor histidine kinase
MNTRSLRHSYTVAPFSEEQYGTSFTRATAVASRFQTTAMSLLSFVWPGSIALTPRQSAIHERRLLDDTALRITLWLFVLFLFGFLVNTLGTDATSEDNTHFFASFPFHPKSTWLFGLAFLVFADLIVLALIIHLPSSLSPRLRYAANSLLAIWVCVIALWWFSGAWTLHHTPSGPQPFILSQQTFVFMTVSGQALTLILLSSSYWTIIPSIIIGFWLPFFLYSFVLFVPGNFSQLSDDDRKAALARIEFIVRWNSVQLFAYGLVGAVLTYSYRRNRARFLLLEVARSRAEAEQRRGDSFVGAISHDLRQPVTVIALKLSSLIDRAQKTFETSVSLDELTLLYSQTESLDNMLEGSLDLSRLQSGQIEVAIRDVSIPLFIDRIYKEMLPAASSKDINFRVSTIPYIMRTDSFLLERIIRNLIANAIQYTPRLGTIILDSKAIDSNVLITVSDNGMGIPPDRLPDIFNEYVQLANSARDDKKGIGLGLSIVRGFANRLGHTLTVESGVGLGTTFSISVPLVSQVPLEYRQSLPPVTSRTRVSIDFQGMMVLVVEDLEHVRAGIRNRLMEWGCYVIDGETAEEVIERVRQVDDPQVAPSVILADYRLPNNTNGIEAIAKIRTALNDEIMAAVVTSETRTEERRHIANNGLLLLTKPIREADLLSLLESAGRSEHADIAVSAVTPEISST